MDHKPLPEMYESAFSRGELALFANRSWRISVVRAGTLCLPSGQIVACDPLTGRMREPFVQAVMPGRYAVDLSLGLDVAEKVERALFARILFTKNKPVIWVKALCENETAAREEQGEAFGFVVRSGTAAYMDQETAALFHLNSMKDVDQFLDRLVSNYRPERNWLNYAVDGEHNLILVSAEKGPGPLPTYYAIDDDGDICLALTRLFS